MVYLKNEFSHYANLSMTSNGGFGPPDYQTLHPVISKTGVRSVDAE
jgi:hypothetical protein